MSSAIETALLTYIRAAREPDQVVRTQLLEACFAADGRIVTRSGQIRGREAVAEMFARVHADPLFERIRVTSAIDAQGTTYRLRSVIERRDGTSAEFFDAGEIDASGKISLVLAFAGELAEAYEQDSPVAKQE